MSIPLDLTTYDNSSFYPGRSFFVRSLWHFFGLPLLRSSLLPSSRFRRTLLRAFGAQIGNGVVMHHGLKVKYPWNLKIGDSAWLGEDCWIDNLAMVNIGSHVCVSQGAYICTGNHDWSSSSFDLSVKPVTIANGAWVGAKSMISPGVSMGECAVAAASSMVTRDVPAYEVHGGNPASFIRKRLFKADKLDPSSVPMPGVHSAPNGSSRNGRVAAD